LTAMKYLLRGLHLTKGFTSEVYIYICNAPTYRP
jgi:hypothetical protein